MFVLYVHVCVCREGRVSVLSTAEIAPAVKLTLLKPQRDSQSTVINMASLLSPLISSLCFPLLTFHSLPILPFPAPLCSDQSLPSLLYPLHCIRYVFLNLPD